MLKTASSLVRPRRRWDSFFARSRTFCPSPPTSNLVRPYSTSTTTSSINSTANNGTTVEGGKNEFLLARFASAIPLIATSTSSSDGKRTVNGSASPPSVTPTWKAPAERFFAMWPKLSACHERYMAFIKKVNPKDLTQAHVFMNDAAAAELVEYYLALALLLDREAVEKVATDSDALLKLAEKVAREQVEPVMKEAQELALEYDEEAHRALEDLTIWREIDDALFWHNSFQRFSAEKYSEFTSAVLGKTASQLEKVLQSQGKPPAHLKDSNSEDDLLLKLVPSARVLVGLDADPNAPSTTSAGKEETSASWMFTPDERALATEVYSQWLNAAGMPVRGTIRNCLLDHSLLHGVPRAWEGISPNMKHREAFTEKKRKNVSEHSFDEK
ncbi:unnamed protein product [Amoebophrya sp. A25]|nr:unnamed protein product [Amoebophrya sp. A25]|eukprot:GSA25T00012441001.1